MFAGRPDPSAGGPRRPFISNSFQPVTILARRLSRRQTTGSRAGSSIDTGQRARGGVWISMHLRLATAPLWAGRSVALLASLALSAGGCSDDRQRSEPIDAGVRSPEVDAALPPAPVSPAEPGTGVALSVAP